MSTSATAYVSEDDWAASLRMMRAPAIAHSGHFGHTSFRGFEQVCEGYFCAHE
jgi:hypothetical protein